MTSPICRRLARSVPAGVLLAVASWSAGAEDVEPPLARILLIRHARSAGEPFATPQRPVRGYLADPLGLRQAEATAGALKRERIDVAFSSPYGRALQTAEIVLAGREVPVHVLPSLREWMPNPALKDAPSTTHERIQGRDAELYAEETWKTELGEGTFEMYARIVPPFLEELAKVGIHSRVGDTWWRTARAAFPSPSSRTAARSTCCSATCWACRRSRWGRSHSTRPALPSSSSQPGAASRTRGS